MRRARLTLLVALAAQQLACAARGESPEALRQAQTSRPAAPLAALAPTPRGLEMHVPTPEDNPLTLAKAQLGQLLFHDPRLSRDGSISCSSCHRSDHAFADTAAGSTGVGRQVGRRNAPALVNRGYGRSFFRDGRAPTLENTVLRPIQAADEMDLTLTEALDRVRADARYRDAFRNAFGTSDITEVELSRALASFVRTLRSGDAPIDRYAAADTAALSAAARRGFRLFVGRANCSACHSGPYFTDERFHNTGVSWGRDPGRAEVTRDPEDRGRFRTPSLRDIALTAPYMHDGSVRTLEEVLEFYNDGGRANPLLDPNIRRLDLSAVERDDLIAFLRALTGRS